MSSSSTAVDKKETTGKPTTEMPEPKEPAPLNPDVHLLSREAEKDLIGDPDLTDPTTVILGGLFDTIYSLQHIVCGLLFAYFCGYFGFHVSWALFTIFIIWALDRKYKESGWKRRFKMFLRDERKSRVIAAEKESCEWLNVALEKFFPIYSPGIADSVESAIIASLEAAMPVPPPPLTHVAVQGVDLGVNPPSIERIKTWQLEGHQWQMDCTLKYHGDIRIVVAAGVGMKGVSVSMPVAIKDLELEGRLRIHMSMTASPPFYKTLTVAFKEKPHIAIGIQPLKAGDLDKGPLGAFLRNTIVDAVGTMMVYPQKLVIELGDPKPEGGAEEEVQLDADARANAEVDSDAGKPMTNERAKKLALQRKPEYIGKLICIVDSGSGLRACDKSLLGKGSSDSYCKIFCGAKSDKTDVVTSTDPKWNKEMQFLVEKAKKYQKLEVQVFDHDKLGKNDSLGFCFVDFGKLIGETDSEQITVDAELQGPKAKPGSKVVLKLTYVVD